jgi:hypothetical protein
MKVSELIEILSEMNADAQVFIASQPNWPFEYSVCGVARRAEMNGDDADDDEAAATYEPGTAPSDVFICEGTQLRYGSKTAWEVARCR